MDTMEQTDTNLQTKLQPYKSQKHLANLGLHVEKAIKKNNVKMFVNKGVGSIQSLPKSIAMTSKDIENVDSANLSQHLKTLKYSCSTASKDINQKQNQTKKIKDDTTFKKDEIKRIETNRKQLQNKIDNLTSQLGQVSLKKQSVIHSLKSYEHILQRMKKDQITHTLRKNYLNNEVKKLEKEYQEVQRQLYSVKQFQQLSISGLKQAKNQHCSQNNDRKDRLSLFNSCVSQNRSNELKKQQRLNQTLIIQQMAAGDLQDADLIRMKKFLTVQLFLKSVLKAKIQRLKSFYQPYELAFYTIKSQTNVKDALGMRQHFFNFQTSYNEKTGFILDLEHGIEEAEKQRKNLQDKLKQEKDRELQMLEQIQETQTQSDAVDLARISEKSLDYEIQMMKIKQWVTFNTSRLEIGQQQNLINKFKILCKNLRSTVQKANIQENENQLEKQAANLEQRLQTSQKIQNQAKTDQK